MNTINLEKGHDVAYNTSNNYFSSCFFHFSKIAKKTKTGIVTLEDGTRFNKYGKELSSKTNSYPRGCLIDIKLANGQIEEENQINISKKKIEELELFLKKASPLTRYQIIKIDELIKSF